MQIHSFKLILQMQIRDSAEAQVSQCAQDSE